WLGEQDRCNGARGGVVERGGAVSSSNLHHGRGCSKNRVAGHNHRSVCASEVELTARELFDVVPLQNPKATGLDPEEQLQASRPDNLELVVTADHVHVLTGPVGLALLASQ